MAIERAHRRRNRHVVVVQDDQQANLVGDAGVVQRLEGHAGGHRAVADHGDAVARLALAARRHRHAQGRRDRRRRVRGAKGVVGRLGAPREARDAALLAQRAHCLAPPGQDLVRIGLVAHVPDDAVLRRVEHVMQRHRQLDRAQVGRQVAAGAGHRIQQELAQLGGQRHELRAFEAAQIGRGLDPGQHRGRRIGAIGSAQWRLTMIRSANCCRRTRRSGGSALCTRACSALSRSWSRPALGFGHAQHRHIGRFVLRQVLAGRLAQLDRSLPRRRGCHRRSGTPGRPPRHSGPARPAPGRSSAPARAPISTAARSKAPVFIRCMRSSCSGSSAGPSAARSKRLAAAHAGASRPPAPAGRSGRSRSAAAQR